jgi:trans-2,3-dihydro-3-hydroxyanthranilate isomerase
MVRFMKYLHYDVFTSTPFEGNQLAVYPEPPRDIAVERMQRIAAEMNFSETTFVFPPEGTGDVRMRIFTPGTELPLAGHPTIGTTFALAREGVIAPGRETFVFELGVGPIPVSLEWGGSGLSFAWMTQLLPSFGAQVADRVGFAAAVGLQPDDLEDLPIEAVSCGVSFLFVPVRTRAAVDRVEISRRDLTRVCEPSKCEDLAVFFFTNDRTAAKGDETVYSRMLAPQFGIAEDPATGGASGPLGSYLLHHGLVTAAQARSMVSLQGVAMKRPSRIHISIDSEGGAFTRVRVGGQSVLVAEGKLLV